MRSFILLALAAAAGCVPPVGPPEGEAPVTQVTAGRGGEDRDPEASPDGTQLFYASSSFGPKLDIFVKPVGSNVATRVTRLPGDERFPKVNPANPRTLAFCSDSGGEWDIYVIDDYVDRPDGVRILSEPGAHDIHPSWSPDGRFLVYSSTDPRGTGEWRLTVKEVATGRTHHLEDIDGFLPQWSPAGNRIVFQRMKQRDRWFSSLWTLEYDEGVAKNPTAIFSSDDWAAINPAWSPDGGHVVFATVAKSRARAEVANEADDLWCVRADGSHATRLTTHPSAEWLPAWAADGRIYFVSRRGGSDRIWSLTPALPETP
jgi:TolB protein